jgi:hypothetical protein
VVAVDHVRDLPLAQLLFIPEEYPNYLQFVVLKPYPQFHFHLWLVADIVNVRQPTSSVDGLKNELGEEQVSGPERSLSAVSELNSGMVDIAGIQPCFRAEPIGSRDEGKGLQVIVKGARELLKPLGLLGPVIQAGA